MEMLESLLDIELAYSLLQSSSDSSKDPLDLHYNSLQADIKVILNFSFFTFQILVASWLLKIFDRNI